MHRTKYRIVSLLNMDSDPRSEREETTKKLWETLDHSLVLSLGTMAHTLQFYFFIYWRVTNHLIISSGFVKEMYKESFFTSKKFFCSKFFYLYSFFMFIF